MIASFSKIITNKDFCLSNKWGPHLLDNVVWEFLYQNKDFILSILVNDNLSSFLTMLATSHQLQR